MQGKIIKGIAGFYYIETHDARIYECKAKGIFRKDNVKPLVGDNVMIDIIDEENKKGNITEILPRKNRLLRPPVANVDQAVILFAIVKPDPNYNLLDRFLIMMRQQNLPVIICFNKQDIATQEEQQELTPSDYTGDVRITFLGDCTLGGEEKKAGNGLSFASRIAENGTDFPFRGLKQLTEGDVCLSEETLSAIVNAAHEELGKC